MDSITTNAAGQMQANGTTASRLLANGMSVNALRTNATLRKEEWIEIDTVVQKVARERLRMAADVVEAGLVKNISNGLGTTVHQWETSGDMSGAETSMDGVTAGQNGRQTFNLNSMPLPITHKDFSINIRTLEASRRLGESLDVAQAEVAARKVAEGIEDLMVNGNSAMSFGGGTIYGYLNHPNRNTVALGTAWTADTGENILADVISMISAAHADRMYGPYVLYVPTAYGIELEKDFKSNSDKSTRQRLLEIDGISAVRTVDHLTADNVLLVQMTGDVVTMINGLEPSAIEWETNGGMVNNFKVMSIMVPRISADAEGRSGIVHLS